MYGLVGTIDHLIEQNKDFLRELAKDEGKRHPVCTMLCKAMNTSIYSIALPCERERKVMERCTNWNYIMGPGSSITFEHDGIKPDDDSPRVANDSLVANAGSSQGSDVDPDSGTDIFI
jgi:hypothetical protein